MSKLKVIKKVLLAAILIAIVVLLDNVFVKYVKAATSNTNEYKIIDYATLLNSKYYLS